MLRIVFGRVNTSGKPMTRDEVFDAIVGSQVVEGEDAGLQLINASIQDVGFGAIDRSTLLSALEAIRGTKLGALDPQTLAAELAAIELDRARSVLGVVVAFLRSRRAGVPHYLVCPYELPIVVLARFFALFSPAARAKPDPAPEVVLEGIDRAAPRRGVGHDAAARRRHPRTRRGRLGSAAARAHGQSRMSTDSCAPSTRTRPCELRQDAPRGSGGGAR